MNKGQGFTTGAGALLLGAALLHPGQSGMSPQVSGAAAPAGNATVASGTEPGAAEGPWTASCNYWRPLGWTEPPEIKSPPEAHGADLDISSKGDDLSWKLHVSGVTSAGGCNAKHWGIPEGPHPPMTAIIATVPDPIHGSSALDFDRFMDVITQAAADNDYLVSHYWLPWGVPLPGGAKSSQSSSADDVKAAHAREQQPGLLILKPAAPAKNSRLIYLFLVAQTPALGINADQMCNALKDEDAFRKAGVGTLSIRDPTDSADIIGPNNSGSAESLKAALLSPDCHGISSPLKFHVVGITGTHEAADALERHAEGSPKRIDYISFGEDTQLEQGVIQKLFSSPRYGQGRIASLGESGTAYGSSITTAERLAGGPIVISFPREISLLRNAQKDEKPATDAVANADPYLHLSLKNSGTEDTIAHFSPDNTPFSQEAQWMAIVRELKARHVETVSVSASNILDELFLAKYLHRDLPDVRVVTFEASDLLFARLGDSAPYLGTIAATPYPLVDLAPSSSTRRLHDFASSWTEQFYNAVSYTLWDGNSVDSLSLSSYDRPQQLQGGSEFWLRPPPLWMTVVGRDGYYPLGIVAPCSSQHRQILPAIRGYAAHENTRSSISSEVCAPGLHTASDSLTRFFPEDRPSYPSDFWYVLCLIIIFICLGHSIALRTSDFWSPVTRDLAIGWSDEPRRRAVYLHIATAMLFSASVVVASPAFFAGPLLHRSHYTIAVAVGTLIAGVLAAGFTLHRTWPFLTRSPVEKHHGKGCRQISKSDEQKNLISEAGLYPVFHWIASLTALFILVLWCALCFDGKGGEPNKYLGLFFAYRCLYPASGVSPLIPILLILLSWYLWAFFQTRRLRFSANSRPMLPHRLPGTPPGLYVPEEALTSCSNPVHSCLFENVTCLLITRDLIRRALHRPGNTVNVFLATLYGVLFSLFVFAFPVRGLDHFLRAKPLGLTPYEFLISALFYPLLVIAVTGGIRMIAVWSSLRTGLLHPLERSSLRFAFSRLTNVAWMTMFKQSGVLEYFRDMARSNQSIRQMIHSSDLAAAMASSSFLHWEQAKTAEVNLEEHIAALLKQIEDTKPGRRRKEDRAGTWDDCGDFLSGNDLPGIHERAFLNLMCAIECDYSNICDALLAGALIPYWMGSRLELVEAEPNTADRRDTTIYAAPKHIQLAEEFLALRYLSLIRALLINLRQLMSFVSMSFVLALLAWNSYPFQPRQEIDWIFTAMLFGLGTCVVWIFAQMHRDPILSRITGTEMNKLDATFYIRLVTFGGVPVLTWLASQFPGIGSSLSGLLQSGMQLAK